MQQNQQNKSDIDLFSITEDYFNRILQEVSGIKCLIVDEETTGIISLIYSQSQILKKDVYLIEKIENPSQGKMMHLKAIYFVRPTEQNLNIIRNDIKNPKFSEYHLYFTNQLPVYEIEKLAEIDENDVVKGIQEVYSDYYTINKDLFTLNIRSYVGLTRQTQQWDKSDQQTLKRMKDGLLSVIFSLRRVPMIRYLANSNVCSSLAEDLTFRISREYQQNQSQFHFDSKTLVLIVERSEDPITPLLNQWTYQAMLHELVGLHNNRIDLLNGMKALDGVDPNQVNDPEKQFVVSSSNDNFYKENMFVNFGELAQNIKDFIDKVQQQRNNTLKLESLEDMAKAVENIPELKRISGNLSKHVTLSMEVSKLVEERQLMTVSKAEQEISTKNERSSHYKMVNEILNDVTIQNLEKLKIVILYAYRYEHCDKINEFKEKLSNLGVKQKSLNLIQYALDFAGKKQRKGDLFQTKNISDIFNRKLKDVFKNCPNVFTQHQPYIMNLINQIKENKLKEVDYKTTDLNQFRGQPKEIILFMVGGCTYEEAEKVAEFNLRNQTQIILGGSYIHNSKTFLAELSQKGFYNESQSINI